MKKQRIRFGSPIERFTRMMFTRIITGLARMLRNEGLSLGHIATLHLLDQHGHLGISEVSEHLDLSVSAASRLADGLVGRDLVSRTEDPEDRRIKLLALTPEGSAFVDQIGEDRVQVILTTAEDLPRPLVESIMSGLRHYIRR